MNWKAKYIHAIYNQTHSRKTELLLIACLHSDLTLLQRANDIYSNIHTRKFSPLKHLNAASNKQDLGQKLK